MINFKSLSGVCAASVLTLTAMSSLVSPTSMTSNINNHFSYEGLSVLEDTGEGSLSNIGQDISAFLKKNSFSGFPIHKRIQVKLNIIGIKRHVPVLDFEEQYEEL